MKRIFFTAILLLSVVAVQAQDKKTVTDSVFFDKAYVANPDPDNSEEWCVNTMFQVTVTHCNDKLLCTVAIANKKIKGYLYNKVNKGKHGILYSFHAIDSPTVPLFSILFTTFADYKKNTGQAEIVDGSHYLAKWYDIKGCFIGNPILWTEK